VNVDLPLAIGIPSDYISDQELRLRCTAALRICETETELDALGSEFRDRFGQLPEMTQNLLYQMRVKLRAEKAGLSAVSQESSGQILLKYTSPADGWKRSVSPDLGDGVRGGKSAYWVTVSKEEIGW